MQWAPFSPKQLSLVTDSDAFVNIADGPIRSGKTIGNLVRWIEFCRTAPPGDLMLVGKTERTLKRNVIGPLTDIAGSRRVKHVAGAGELYLSGRRIYLVGANDERAEEKIRGATLVGAYVNEVTLIPESAFNQLLGRASMPGAQIFGDTNPDSPYHWLYREWLTSDRLLDAGDLKRWQFTIDDNWSLTEAYKDRLKRLYTGLWYQRMILGRWVMAEGRIYDVFDEAIHVVDDDPKTTGLVHIGVDYGTSNPTVFLLVAWDVERRRWTVLHEYRYDGRAALRQRTDMEYSADLRAFMADTGLHPRTIEIDPSAASFIAQLRRDGVTNIHQADNAVLDGIRTVSRAIASGQLVIHRRCTGLIEELATYSWDSKAQKRGEDKPLKEHDHGPDALRYACMRIFSRRYLT